MKSYILSHKRFFIKAILLITISSMVQLSFDFFKGSILDYAVSKESDWFYGIGLLYLAAVLLKSLTHFLYTKNYHIGKVLSFADFRRDFFQGILRNSYPEFKQNSSGYYINKYANEFPMIDQLLFQSTYALLQTVTELFFALIGFIIIDFKLFVLGIGLMGLSMSIPFLMKKWVSSKNTAMLDVMARHTSKVKNYMDGHEIIYNYRAFDQIAQEYDRSNRELKLKKVLYTKAVITGQYLSKAFSQVSILLIMGLSIYLVKVGNISIGKCITAISILISVQSMTSYIATNTQNILTSKSTIASVKEVSDFVSKQSFGGTVLSTIKQIRFDHIHFSYPRGKKVLQDVSLEADRKGLYLIQGKSGSGKSTLMNLLLQYYQPNSGKLYVNGIDLREVENINSQISVMRQEAGFFEDSLRENLRIYDERIRDEEIFYYMNRLGLEKYANRQWLDRCLENNGDGFSGGERRRLSFIRTILKDVEILILDEPFANVDEESVEKLARMIDQVEDKFVFLITHQLPKRYDLQYVKVLSI